MPITQQARLRDRDGEAPQAFITRVPLDLAGELRAYATANSISINSAIVAALRHYLKKPA